MFYYYLFLFCLLYDLLVDNPCSAHYFLNRHTKEIGRTLPKHTMIEKDDLPQYIDEVVEVPTDEEPLFENLRLTGVITRHKPGLFPEKKIFRQGLA
ncbi:hypothetical protein ANCCAN_02009 [Ancylostoma caninum]|uniref:Uncharacterized protein n=1 Tax=Ancylostoma caninum TaxID=29170 RepID=A0A368H5P9_ANCCA|nr:hypothetical protein ANCCAN_02009 [Ancylostoma caninum]